jgi:hypothetical protein
LTNSCEDQEDKSPEWMRLSLLLGLSIVPGWKAAESHSHKFLHSRAKRRNQISVLVLGKHQRVRFMLSA